MAIIQPQLFNFMSTQAGVGISRHRNPKVAGQEAAAQALEQAKITQPDFVFVFATVGYRQKILIDSVRIATNHAPLFGCSAAGIIAQGLADESNFAVAVMVIRSDELQFNHGVLPGLSESSMLIGQMLGQQLTTNDHGDAIALFLNADAMTVNFDELMTGLETMMDWDSPLPIIGGLCGDNFSYQKTYQYCDDQVVSDSVSWALLSGQAALISEISHGCMPIGQKRTITRAEGNKIYEIDHQPVFDVLHDYLEDDEIANWDKTAVNLGLGFPAPDPLEYGSDLFIRCMISKEDSTNCVVASANIEEGSDFWITRRDTKKMHQAAEATADQINRQLNGRQPKFVFHIECDGRGKMIMPEKEKQNMVLALQEKIGQSIPWIGLYSYGEICPVNGKNRLHSFTGVLSVVC